MNRPKRLAMWCVAVVAVLMGVMARADDQPPAKTPKIPAKAAARAPAARAPAAKAPAAKAAPADAPAKAETPPPSARLPKSPYRTLAPGVVEDVSADRKLEESVSRHDVVELIAVDDKFDWAKDVPFRHDVWSLEFKFKPVRMMWVDVPDNRGQMSRKLIWYMVYSVTNPGKTMHPVEQADGTYKVELVDKPVRFMPIFNLEVHCRLDEKSPEDVQFKRVYVDRLIPVALEPIRMREDRNRRFFNTTEISKGEIDVGKTAWGIVTWQDVNPRTKWFSIYVEGLTNAYLWKDATGAFTAADFGKESAIGKGRQPQRKILKLNFYRPSDEYFENEKEIRYGVPGHPDYEWVYLPPQ